MWGIFNTLIWEWFEINLKFLKYYIFIYIRKFSENSNISQLNLILSAKIERLVTFYNIQMTTYVLYFMINYKNQFPILCFTQKSINKVREKTQICEQLVQSGSSAGHREFPIRFSTVGKFNVVRVKTSYTFYLSNIPSS